MEPNLVKAVVDSACALDLDLIAEGVEGQTQARLLSGLGCKDQQDFYHGRPMPESRLDAKHHQLVQPSPEVAA